MRKSRFPVWEGLRDPESGRLSGRVPLAKIPTEGEVSLEDGELQFIFPRPSWPESSQGDPARLLEQFVGLRDDVAIRKFAERWGALHLCPAHELPRSHAPDCTISFGNYITIVHHTESLVAWRRYVCGAGAILAFIQAAGEGHRAQESEWAALEDLDLSGLRGDEANALRSRIAGLRRSTPLELRERRRLAMSVNLLLSRCQVFPSLVVGEGSSEIVLADSIGVPNGISVLGAIAAQLLSVAAMSATSVAASIAVCSSCGRPYFPKRQPAASRLRFCADCKPAAWRLSKQRNRALQAERAARKPSNRKTGRGRS